MKLQPNFIATIVFLSPEEGGSKHLPAEHLAAPVRISGVDGWTLLMEFLSEPHYGRPIPAFIDFLSEDAPYELVVPETEFEILRGTAVIGKGSVKIAAISEKAREAERVSIIDCDTGPVRIEREVV